MCFSRAVGVIEGGRLVLGAWCLVCGGVWALAGTG